MILFRANSTSSIYVRLLFSMVALCLLITFGSCSDDDAPAEITPNPDSEIYFTGSLDFTSDSGEAILSFTTNKDWSIDVSQSGGDVSWCTVFPNKGKAGESQVSVRVARNEGVDDRNVVLNLTAGDLTKSIVVTQKQKDAITLTTAKFEVDKNGGEIQVEVKANVSYEVVIPEQYQSWIREGSGSGQIIMGDKGHNQMHEPATRTDMDRTVRKFYISKSEEYDKREGEIIFRSGELEEVLKVYQTGGGILLLTKNEYTVSDKGEQIVVELNSNFDFDVKMPQVDWITTTATRSVSSHTLYYTIAPNGTYGKREAEIIYYDRNDKSVADTLKIIQVQKDAIMLSQKEYSVGMEGGTIRIEIKANVAYETFIPEQYRGWIHKGTSTRGLSTSNLSFIIDKNNEYNKREGEIIFQNGKQKEVLKVCQAERAFLNLIKNEYTISDEGGRIAVELNSNFDFDVRMPQVDWITVTTTRSVSTHTLYYMIAPNEAYNKREAKIIYYNRNNEGLADTLNVVQQGKSVLELTLETAGSLKRKMEILNIDYLKVKKIVLEGDINGSDIRLIREMAGVNYIEKETNGVLEYLDLTNVNIVEGGEIYCYPDSYKPGTLDKYEDCYTKNNVIGNCMFRKCKSLKKVLLPYSCVKIENESFYISNTHKCSSHNLSPSLISIFVLHLFHCQEQYVFLCSGMFHQQIPVVVLLTPFVTQVVDVISRLQINCFFFHIGVGMRLVVPQGIFHIRTGFRIIVVQAIEAFKRLLNLVPFQRFLLYRTPLGIIDEIVFQMVLQKLTVLYFIYNLGLHLISVHHFIIGKVFLDITTKSIYHYCHYKDCCHY